MQIPEASAGGEAGPLCASCGEVSEVMRSPSEGFEAGPPAPREASGRGGEVREGEGRGSEPWAAPQEVEGLAGLARAYKAEACCLASAQL